MKIEEKVSMVNYDVMCAMRSKANSVGWGLTWTSDVVHCVGNSILLVSKEEEETKLAKANIHWVIKINNLSKYNKAGARYHIVFDQNKINKIKTNIQMKNLPPFRDFNRLHELTTMSRR